MQVSEGTIEVEIPEDVFYNPVQELNRDLTIATLRAYRERRPLEDYLDAMTASGIRGVRAAAEGLDVTMCDVDEDAVALARSNLERNGLPGEVVHAKANPLMHNEWFDVVDLDPFGSPIPFVDAAFNSANHLVCVTATDTAPLCGAHFNSGVRTYSAVPRNTEFHAEMGTRILLSALVRTAARYDLAARPVFTHAANHYVRTYLELESGAQVADAMVDELGFVEWCPDCLWRDHEDGLIPHPREECPHCGHSTKTAGPLYLGLPHDREFVAEVRERVDPETMGSAKQADKLLGRIQGELDVPTHYDQHKLYETWTEPAIGMDDFLALLHDAGFEATRTHYGGTTFKTGASVGEIRAAVEAAE